MRNPADSYLELDLAFHPAKGDAFTSSLNKETKCRLTKAKLWHKDLKAWIEWVRLDRTLQCHEIVRQNNLLSIGLHLTDDETITQINQHWRQKTETTDVLSFPALDQNLVLPKNTCIELGDIVVSVPTAQRQANEYCHDLIQELRWLICHGLLHLLGWDHQTNQSLKRMLSCQQQLLSINGKVQLHS